MWWKDDMFERRENHCMQDARAALQSQVEETVYVYGNKLYSTTAILNQMYNQAILGIKNESSLLS